MVIFDLIQVAFYLVMFAVFALLVVGAVFTTIELFREERFERFLCALVVGFLVLVVFLSPIVWLDILAFVIPYLLVANPSDSESADNTSGNEEEGGLDAGDGFLIGLWIASLFERNDR